jgi:TetR/AcrR family transcriptional regulator, regulator of cefoperazone and chloramphenicol sensitivity
MKDKATVNHSLLKQRIVDAAAKVFAEKGFAEATIREICRRAKVNIAAVNYYWGSKEHLYRKVIEELIIERKSSYPFDVVMDESLPPEVRLEKFIELYLYRLLDSGRPAWSSKIMVREMTQPTEAVNAVIDKLIKPTYEILTSIIKALYGNKASEDKIKLAAASIISQCIFYFNTGNIMDRLISRKMLPVFKLEEVAEHITNFSLKGLGHN